MNRYIYEMRKISDSQESFPEIIDLLIIAAGADYRSYEVLRKAKNAEVHIGQILIICFRERVEDSDLEYKKSYNLYKDIVGKTNIKEINTSIRNPSDCIKKLNEKGVQISNKDNLAIDISCFTKPYFFSFLKYFEKVIGLQTISVFYTEPKSYLFNTGLYDSFKSSSGPTIIKELFTGSDSKDQQRLLVILLGFDGDISREIDEEIGPKNTLIVNGFPGFSPKFKDISLVNNEKLVSNENIGLLYSKANNPFETYNLLDSIVSKMDSKKYLNIAPLGTKPMALGACLYAIHNPDVRVIYPIPDKYENTTTEECWDSWYYKIPLSIKDNLL